MAERELLKLEGTIRTKMEDIRKQRASLIAYANVLAPVRGWHKTLRYWRIHEFLEDGSENLYEKILPGYKQMVGDVLK